MTRRFVPAGKPFDPRKNSLNLFRLILAAMVLFAHSWPIVGAGGGPSYQGENFGGWAVAGFFAISGFLITGSRMKHSAGEYILHRVARIFPAFLVCLAIMAFVFAPIVALVERGTLAGFLTTPTTPLNFVWANAGLHMMHYDISGTLSTVPYPSAWNGSLWTLYYEFLCYLIVWVLGGWAVFRRSAWPAVVLLALSVTAYANLDLVRRLGLNEDFVLLMRLLPFFLGGVIVHYVIGRFGVNRVVGVASVLVAAALISFIPGWGGQLAAPFLAYALLFLSTLIPQPSFIARNDVSYGFYIYAWPVQQLLVLAGADALGLPTYMVIASLITAALAYLSWIAVERPALRTVKRSRAVSSSTTPTARPSAAS